MQRAFDATGDQVLKRQVDYLVDPSLSMVIGKDRIFIFT